MAFCDLTESAGIAGTRRNKELEQRSDHARTRFAPDATGSDEGSWDPPAALSRGWNAIPSRATLLAFPCDRCEPGAVRGIVRIRQFRRHQRRLHGPGTQAAPHGTLIVIDCLQLVDQKRENPASMAQVRLLKSFAEARGLIVVFISRIDRSYDPARKPCPDIADVRLPNPPDLSLFSKTCFPNDGEIQFHAT